MIPPSYVLFYPHIVNVSAFTMVDRGDCRPNCAAKLGAAIVCLAAAFHGVRTSAGVVGQFGKHRFGRIGVQCHGTADHRKESTAGAPSSDSVPYAQEIQCLRIRSGVLRTLKRIFQLVRLFFNAVSRTAGTGSLVRRPTSQFLSSLLAATA